MRRRFLLLLIAGTLPLLVVAGAVSVLWLHQKQETMQSDAIHRAQEILASVERELFADVELAKVLGDSLRLDQKPADLDAFHEIATRFVRRMPGWDRVILLDPQGQQVVNSAVPFGTPLPRAVDQASFQEAIQNPSRLVAGVSSPGPFSKDGRPALAFRVPVYRDGELRFILTPVLKLDPIGLLVDVPGLPPEWRPFVVDGRGRIVAHPRAPERVGQRGSRDALELRQASRSGVYDVVSQAGEPVKVAFARSTLTDWSAQVAIPLAVYHAPVLRGLFGLCLSGMLVLAAGLAMIFLFRREFAEQRMQDLHRERATRMESLGRMTGGVAHDFNNLLMVILGNLEILQRRNENPAIERYLREIRRAGERASHLTRELLSFSRGEPGQPLPFDVNERLRGLLGMLRQSLRENIQIELALAAEPLPICVDPIQFDLAILNIAINARDAMPEGGSLRFSTSLAAFPDRSGRQGIALAIADTGSGIPEQVLPHVFEPFFTTKQIGKGTGLGLSQVYGFAKAAGGMADIDSRIGRGTIVSLYLPSAPAAELSAAQVTASTRDVRGRTRVLLVDDNEQVRTVTADALRELGFEVRQAGDAAEALDALKTELPDVLVSDVVMPGERDGLALAAEARRQWPNVGIVLISGYNNSAPDRLSFPVLRKPFAMTELAVRIRETAASRGDSSRNFGT